jgi:hypothetical protein
VYDPVVWFRFAIGLLLGAVGCSQLLGIDDLGGPSDATTSDGAKLDAPGPAAECKAQRVVHLVGGSGGLAWFTLAWPAPPVIIGFQPTFAYDDPTKAKDITIEPGHPLFARRIGAGAIWEGLGQDPHPSVFVAGNNETHTNSPVSIVESSPSALVAAGATIQVSLAPTIRVLGFVRADSYGTAPGAPMPVVVMDVDGAIAALSAMGGIPPAVEQQLRPSAAQLANYIPPGAVPAEVALGTQLAFTANAFRLGLIGTVIMPAYDDDPHGAFAAGGNATPRANELATVLNAFYRDLSASSELTCGHNGNFLSLADNTVLVVMGGTPKNSFDNNGWPDGTPGNANLMYVRSNGFLRPGWFGQLQPGTRTNFNPTTGALDGSTGVAASTTAAVAGALYAIARGDKITVTSFTGAPFDGLILH